MRTSNLLLASVALVVSVAAVPRGVLSVMCQDKINVFDGWFVPSDDFPAAFKDINMIQVVNPAHAKSPPYGYVELKGAHAPRYPLLKPTLDGEKLSFKTTAVRGVSYEFSGTLPKTEFEKPPDDVVLTGTLKKLQAGRVIAEGKVTFGWFAGD